MECHVLKKIVSICNFSTNERKILKYSAIIKEQIILVKHLFFKVQNNEQSFEKFKNDGKV